MVSGLCRVRSWCQVFAIKGEVRRQERVSPCIYAESVWRLVEFWEGGGMPTSVPIQYAGAVYHVLCRCDRRAAIFADDADRERFLASLAQMCERTGMLMRSYRFAMMSQAR